MIKYPLFYDLLNLVVVVVVVVVGRGSPNQNQYTCLMHYIRVLATREIPFKLQQNSYISTNKCYATS